MDVAYTRYPLLRYNCGITPSTFEGDLVLRTTMYWNVRANIQSEFHAQSSTKGAELHVYNFFFHVAHVFY